jgi:hypothetical protein
MATRKINFLCLGWMRFAPLLPAGAPKLQPGNEFPPMISRPIGVLCAANRGVYLVTFETRLGTVAVV